MASAKVASSSHADAGEDLDSASSEETGKISINDVEDSSVRNHKLPPVLLFLILIPGDVSLLMRWVSNCH